MKPIRKLPTSLSAARIRPMGTPRPGTVPLLISSRTIERILDYSEQDVHREMGGFLLGNVYDVDGEQSESNRNAHLTGSTSSRDPLGSRSVSSEPSAADVLVAGSLSGGPGMPSVHLGGSQPLAGTGQDEAPDQLLVEVEQFVPARETAGSIASLTFTHETWSQLHRQVEANYPELRIVGWQHTHPDFGVFLSEYDRFIHRNFFSAPWQVAMVVDPLRQEFGFYQWLQGDIVDCGFYCRLAQEDSDSAH